MRRWCQVPFASRAAVAAILVFFCLSCSHRAPGEVPRAVKGVVDLSAWRFETHGPMRLDGEWEFYWGRLADPSDLLAGRAPAPSFRPVPGLWNRSHEGTPGLPVNGYATYSLRLTGLTPSTPLALSIPEMRTAYRMWLDTMEVASNGIVGTDRAHSSPQYLPQTITVFPQRHEARLIVQVANFHGPAGGIPRSIIAGTQHQIILRALDRRAFNVFLISALLVIALYYAGQYATGKKEPTLLLLGVLGAVLIAKSLVVGDRLLVQFFPAFPWGLLQKIEIIPMYLGVAVYANLFYALYPKETGRRMFLLIFWASLGMAGLLMALPTQAMFSVHSPGEYFRGAAGLYAVYLLVLAIIRKREGAVAIAIGWLFQVATIPNDTLNERDIIQSTYLAHAGLIVFSLLAGSVINRRFIRAGRRTRERQDELAHIEKLATLGTVVAGVAHEINNPNNSLHLDAQTQQKALAGLFNVLDEREAAIGEVQIGGYGYQDLKLDMLAASERMIRNSQRITRIVSNLRALGRKDVPMDENIDLNATVLSALGVVDHVVKRATRALRLELAQGIPVVKGNSQHLEQVVINLVRNACQALPDMDSAVTIATGFDAAQRQVSLTVADQGSGMDEETRKNALNPFYTTKGTEGTGLGLSICKNIVTAHGGTISIDSAPGKGTTIRIILPVTPAHV